MIIIQKFCFKNHLILDLANSFLHNRIETNKVLDIDKVQAKRYFFYFSLSIKYLILSNVIF